MILVTGATGNFGKATIQSLLNKGVPANTIAALVRDESKAADLSAKGVQVRIGDYDNKEQLQAAMIGVDKLLLVSGSDIEKRIQQHANVLEAAKNAGVKHIVYTSFARKNETETSPLFFIGSAHIATEQNIKSSGIPYTILLNSLYSDVLPLFLGEQVLETGVFIPGGTGKASFTSRVDMAEAAANVLTETGHENKEYVIASSEKYSFGDVANMLSTISGKTVGYVSPSVDVYSETLSGAGVPAEAIGMVAAFGTAIDQGEFDTQHSDLEQLLGRKPTTLNAFLTSVYA